VGFTSEEPTTTKKDDFPFKTENKKTQIRKKVMQEKLFPDARNFK
jgi:hypothetical protein